MKSKTKTGVKKLLWTTLCLLAGNAVLAFLVAAFIIPHNILMGGSTGVGILLSRLLPWDIPTSAIVLVLNVVLLLIGLVILGKKFFLTTVVSSILYPILLGIMQRIPAVENLTENTLLAVLLGGALLGVSIGIVMRVGASTGGTDVIVLILNKYLHVSVGVLVYVTDIIIIIAQVIFGSSLEDLCYGIILLLLESIVLNKVMILGKSQIQIFVVSEKYNEIRRALLDKLEAGVTMNMIKTGQFGKLQEGVLCIIPPRKLYAATQMVHQIDPGAFITITEIKEVQGQGFTAERLSRKAEDDTAEISDGQASAEQADTVTETVKDDG